MPIGKSKRFDVFTRDQFTCQYCGKQPPGVVLEVDHIHPVSKGGTDDNLNLITACYDCNRGKRAKVLSEVSPRPDADLAFLKLQQEAAEVKRYLKAKRELSKVHGEAVIHLQRLWSEYISAKIAPPHTTIVPWLNRYGVDEVEQSILIAGRRWGGATPVDYAYRKAVPYVGAILRNREKEADGSR